ncbi:MAG: oligosaccharide flippase family protein, partial [Geminicoccaceae bacterium]
DLFDEPRLALITAVLALSPLLTGFQNIGVVDFRKSFDFRRDFLFMTGAKVVGVIVTVALALIWRNYWALVGGMLASALWLVAASYALHPFRPRLSLKSWYELIAFTKWLLLHNILLYFRNRTDRLVIGKLLGAATLGIYTLAFELANLVTTELMAPIRRALFPGYAKLAGDAERMRGMFVDVFALTLWIGAPIPIGIGLLAEPLISLLLGSNWLAAVPVTQLLVIAGFAGFLSSGSQPVYLASGRPELQTMLMGLNAALVLPAVIVGVNSAGLLGAAIALILVQTIIALLDIAIVLSLLKLRAVAIVTASWRSVTALGLMAASVHTLQSYWPEGKGAFGDALLLLSAAIAGGAVYAASSLLLWRLSGSDEGAERYIWRTVRGTAIRLQARIAQRKTAVS